MEREKEKDTDKKAMHSILFDRNIFIIWKPEYNLGIPIIDEQHRGIVTIINSLYFGMQHDCIKKIFRPIIAMMENYTNIHFQTEETFLEKVNFPTAAEHHKLHRELSSKLTSIGVTSIMKNDPYEFMEFLKKWWIHHICNEDLIYRNYLQET